MAELQQVIAELRSMTKVRVNAIVKDELSKAARPFAPRVRAAILNTPAYGPKHTGLRVRIAACVQTWSDITAEGNVSVGVKVNSSRMPPGQYSLPLMLNGNKVWRHPVYGGIRWGGRFSDLWVTQSPHPYWQEGIAGIGPASRVAVERAVERIATIIEDA